MILEFLGGMALGALFGAALVGLSAILVFSEELFGLDSEAEKVYTIKKEKLKKFVANEWRLRNLKDALDANPDITGASISFDRYGAPLRWKPITSDFANDASADSYYCRRGNPNVYVGPY
ncbi:MAG: hypothetical protein IJY15_11005 [Thermoguttaceae bacterium]|nr:hypothetical protein [Thermoguttaceae bacterium]MBQ9128272.1 hypothetical protein [Thermoguttaceae bacterium]